MVDSFNQQNNVGVNVGFQVDKRQARDAATTLDEFNRAVKDVERQRGLSHIARDAAEVVKQTDSARQGAIRLQAELVKVGATQSEVRKVVGEYDRLVQKQQQAAEQARRVAEETSRANAEFIAAAGDPDFGALGSPATRGRSNLRRLGRSARVQLPAVPIGGIFSSEQIARAVEGIGAAEDAIGGLGTRAKVAAGAIGIAGIAITAFFVTMVQEAKRAREEANLALGGAKDYFELINTGTVESIREQQKANEVRRAIALQNLDFQVQVVRGLEEAVDEMGTAARVTTELGVATGLSAQELAAARDAFDAANKEFQEANTEAANLERALNSDEVQMRSTAKAALELAEARQKEFDASQRRRLSLLREFADDDDLDAFDKQLAARKEDLAILEEFIVTEALSAEAKAELTQEYVALRAEVVQMSGSLREEVAARDAARVAVEDQKRTQEEIADATRGYQEAIADLAEDTANKRIQIEQGYADKITDLTRKYTEDVEKAVVSLQRKQADIALDVNRDIAESERKAQFDRLQEQIEFGNETAKQSRELERELARIRDDAANNQLDLIRNRDFAGLERLERDRDRALDQAVDNFNVEQREREIAFRQQQELTNQELVFEAETRRIRFEQQIEDARRAHDRQLADLQQANLRQRQLLAQSRQSELNQLAVAESAKLQLLAQGYSQELKLAAQTTAMRVNLLQQEQQALLAFASAFQGGGGVVNNTSNSRSVSVPISIQSGASQQQLQQLGPTIQTLVVKAIDQLIN